MDFPLLWFGLLGILLAGYAILDGFDLGVGILHLRLRDDTERRLALNAIGPLWDGNEVWLVTFGGALFAAFPEVYATLLSAFYIPVMLILAGLIGRAISIEFRSKVHSAGWRTYWDVSFAFSSFVVTAVFGFALGNVIHGIPIGADREFAGNFASLLHPFAFAVSAFAVAGAAMHGSIYLYLKTEGDLQARVRPWMMQNFVAFAVLFVVVSLWAVLEFEHATENFRRRPVAWIVVILNVLSIANIPRMIVHRRAWAAFVSSSCTIAALTFTVGMALFPYLARSSLEPDFGIDIYEGSSSTATLRLMAIIAAIGMPLVLSYTTLVYWVFRGKVRLDEHSY